MFIISMTACSIGIVCLGQALYGNGSVSLSFMKRIEKTVELIGQIASSSSNDNNLTAQINKNNNSQVDNNDGKILLILSGADVATVGISEARYMFNCIQKRMPSTVRAQVNIFLDENSTNTLGNALNCCKIISDQVRSQNPDIHHIALVTNEFHMPRAHLLFKSALRKSQVRIHALPAENGLAPGNEYRPLSNRPVDANEWTVRERLDWEWNGLCSLEPLLQSDHDNDNDDYCHSSSNNIGTVKGKGSGSVSGSNSGRLLTIRQEDLDVAKEQIRKLNETNYQNDSRSPLMMKYFIPSNLSTWQ